MKKVNKPLGRREFLRAGGLVGAGVAASAMMHPAEAREATASSREKGSIRYGMLIDLKKCVGCRSCSVACKMENLTPPGVTYNYVMEQEVGKYPNVRRKYVFKPCMHCRNPSCTTVCPTRATYVREDGIVVVDYDLCIGCRYCMIACPYDSRAFDYGYDYHKDPTPNDRQPSPEYGQDRKRVRGESPIGNVRKCHFCLHRVRQGMAPACAATCIGKAIHFGNLADPDGRCFVTGEKLQPLLASRSHLRLKEELGNEPSVYYLT